MIRIKIKSIISETINQSESTLIKLIIILIITLSFSRNLLAADEIKPQLNIKPKQCVALLQGKPCYVTVELNWQVAVSGDYCIYSSQRNKALQCWKNKKNGAFIDEFVAKVDLHFYLRQENSLDNLVNAEVKMAWVHKRKGKPRKSWRMF